LSAPTEVLHRFAPPWIEVGRLYRRICFLRSEGLSAEARILQETEFVEAAARAKGLFSSGPEADSLLGELMAEEEERVAEAVAFAEVLVPILARRLPVPPPAKAAPAAAPAPRARARGGPAETPTIADFIDDMLAQDGLAHR
jgi:hypothetical protein